ncbi:hypothetical protein [Tenggerimyces flavus]|uniref:Uncharacterized protein n=1 Tax=Tenggerimyces flavus TaxID=1708749 RepID=A0ABV7YP29_9ACTN|nr:hypothetical protein [Tenggerimyces flavus]MBM7784912.1 hypothetical protein [Tenggerimyces flavus]
MSRLRVLAFGLLIAAAVLKGVAGLLLGLTVVLATELLILRLQLTDGQPGNTNLRWPWRRKKIRVPFPSYERIAGDLSWAHYSVRDFDHGLRRRLLRALEVRLSDGSGIDLAKQPDRARALLGEHAWSVLRPGEPARDDRGEPGYELRALDDVVRAIESLPSTTSAEKEHP